MNKLDFTRFDFHALRFLKSEDVEIMTAEEVGQFVLLMCHAWLGGKAASLPNNPMLLAKYARCERVSEAVMREWKEGTGGRLYNETLSEEWDAAVGRSAHGMRGAAARWNKDKSPTNAHGNALAMPEHNPSNAPPFASPMPKPYQAVPNQSNTFSSEAGASDEQVLKPTPKPSDEKLLAVERVWAYYIQKLGKNPKLLSFTAGRKQKGLARLRECLEKECGDLGRAEGLMRAAIDALAASPYHRGENVGRKRYDSWEKNLFKDQDQTENWLDSAKQGQFQKPQRRSENHGGEDARPYLEPMPPLPCAPRQ